MNTAPGISTAQMATTIALLLLVLAATFYATRFIAKLANRQQQFKSGASGVTLTSRLPVGKNQSVVTIVYNGREYLLGVAENGVTSIDSRELTAAELEALKKDESADFSQRLSNAVGRFKKSGGGENE